MKLNQPRMLVNGYVKICNAEVNYLYGLDDLCQRHLLKRSKPSVLEIGCNQGVSTKLLCQYSNDVTSVDPRLLPRMEAVMEEYPYVKHFPMMSDEFFRQNTKKYDLIYVDGDHSFEQADKDIANGLLHLKPNGIVCGHDFHLSCPGVMKAVHKHFTLHEVFQDSSWAGITCRDA